MKQSLIFGLALSLLVATTACSLQSECTLSAEFFPLEYYWVTRSVSFRVRFTSNCMNLRDFTFEGLFSFANRLSKQRHPVMIDLVIYRNRYRLFFSDQKEANQKTILRKYIYNQIKVSQAGKDSGNVKVNDDNRVILEQQINNSYSMQNLKNLLFKFNPRFCKVAKENKRMTCTIS